MHSGKIAAQTRCRQRSVLSTPPALNQEGGGGATAPAYTHEKIRMYPCPGAQPRGDPLCSMASSSHRHLAGVGRSCQACEHPLCMHACSCYACEHPSCVHAGRHAVSSTVSSLVINISSMHHAGAGSGEMSIVDHAVAHIAGCVAEWRAQVSWSV